MSWSIKEALEDDEEDQTGERIKGMEIQEGWKERRARGGKEEEKRKKKREGLCYDVSTHARLGRLLLLCCAGVWKAGTEE